LTAITDAEKDPALMGFSLLGDEPALFPDIERQQPEDIQIAPEDVVIGRETEDGVEMQEGVQVPLEGKLVFSPSPTDMVLVNGVNLLMIALCKASNCIGISLFEHFRFEIYMFYTSSQSPEAART
jgi:hypothetical protein